MDWSTIYDTAQQWWSFVEGAFKQGGWVVIGAFFMVWQIKRIDDNQNEKKIGAAQTIERGVISQEEISIRYLISIEGHLEKISLVLAYIFILGVVAVIAPKLG